VRLALPAARALALTALAALLLACGAEASAPPTTAPWTVTAAALPPLALTPSPPTPTTPPPTPAPAPTPPLDPTAAAAAAYRAWMEEARALHPYVESVEQMWAVMICESSGDAAVVAGAHQGLFQYSAETWGGAWNPYRDLPILDPRAQIFATAKAWQDGHQSWWGCY
jgi:hypothetical protein